MQTTLSSEREAMVIEIRKSLWLPLVFHYKNFLLKTPIIYWGITRPLEITCLTVNVMLMGLSIDWLNLNTRKPMVEGRFNGRISSMLKTTRFNSSDHLNQTLINYMKACNYSIPQKTLGHISPIMALKTWRNYLTEKFMILRSMT